MLIRDLTCNNCGCDYEVDDFGTSFTLHLLDSVHHCVESKDSDEIKCPCCGSVSYSERHFDNPWDEE